LNQPQRVIGYSITSSAMASSVEGIFFAAVTAVIAVILGIGPRAWNMRAPKSVEAYRSREESLPHCSASRRCAMLGNKRRWSDLCGKSY
jgi:hypothetical protein